MTDHLHHKLAVLHQSLLHGKLPRSLHWSDALELIGHLGQVDAQANEEFAFTVGTQRAMFKRPHTPELGVAEVSRLRKFLKEATSQAAPLSGAQPIRMIVVIDHHAAHIYRDRGKNRPEPEETIEPYDPHHFHHHLVHRKESHYRGDRVPEEASFYEEIATALSPAEEIVLIGHATGKSSAVDVLMEHLKKHHPNAAQRVKAVETADLSALTDSEIESLAKRHMNTVA